MASESWWSSQTSLETGTAPGIPEMNQVWAKMSPITLALLQDIEDAAQYWESADRIVSTLAEGQDVSHTNFPDFIAKLYSVREQLDPQTPEAVVTFLTSSPKVEDAIFSIWKFSNCLRSPYLYLTSLNLLFSTRKAPLKQKIADFSGSLDYIFDHYFPMLEAMPYETDAEAVRARISMFELLCRLLVDYPDKITRFKDFHRLMWNRLLRIMRNSSITISIAAFRTAVEFYKTTMDRIDGQTQASWLLKLIVNNPAPSPLHHPSIRFAMEIRPREFGFITLCKTLIEQGITDQFDIGMISRVLRLPCIKVPTDVFQYLFKTACRDKLIANATRRAIQRPLLKFKDFAPMRPWILLFTKRCFQFVVFAYEKKKYIRRIYCILHFYAMLLTLNIDWLSKVINVSAATILKMGKCQELFGNRFQMTDETDAKLQEELEKTPVERLNIKAMLDDVKVNLQLTDPVEADGSAQGSGRPSGRKPTIAEVKARFMAQRRAGNAVQTTDLELLEAAPPPPARPAQKLGPEESETY